MTSAARVRIQLPATASAAARSRPMASRTRDRLAIRPMPISPGANSAKPPISSGTWPGCRARTWAAGTVMAASTAAPSQDTSMTARQEAAQVRSNSAPSRADSTGKALTAIDSASTACTELNASHA